MFDQFARSYDDWRYQNTQMNAPNFGMPSTPPPIPPVANPPQNPGRFMQQAMQLSGVPGLMGNQQGQGNAPTGYVPRANLQRIPYGYGIPGSFNGSAFNLGMGVPPDFSGLQR